MVGAMTAIGPTGRLKPVPPTGPAVAVTEAADRAGARYWVWGNPDAATTVVAVHGFRGDHHGLLPITNRLDGFRVVTPDLPGFGGSAPFSDRAHDVDAYAEWLTGFCRETTGDAERLVVIGHSFGSVISAAAVAGGLTLDELVLVNPIAAPALQGPRAVLSKIAVGYYRAGALLPERLGGPLLTSPLIVRALSEVMATTDDPDLRAWIHDQHRRYFSSFADRRVVLEAFQASVSHHVGEYAARITSPALLIAGDRDDIVPVPAVQRLAERIDDSRLLVLADVGHLIHYERADPAAAAITEFLSRPRRSADDKA
jgi:pimeloyl-ACP methyl ester carboxylesterase